MNIRERVMAVLHREEPDRIPWLVYEGTIPRGGWERELRNMGLGLKKHAWDLTWASPPAYPTYSFFPSAVYWEETPNVKVKHSVSRVGSKVFVTTAWETPVGGVSQKARVDLTWAPWITEYMIKDLSDYDAVKFMIEDTVFHSTYENWSSAVKQIGDDGYCVIDMPGSAFERLIFQFMGYETLAKHVYRHPKELEELVRVIDEKQYERAKIVADSPAEVILIDDSLNGRVTSPKLFDKHVLPTYKRLVQIFHKKGKIVELHCDGAENSLKDLIPKTGIDVVEALTPPPIGDLPLDEARAAFGEKMIIAANFPETVFFSGVKAVKKKTFEMLRSIAPGDRFMLVITEDVPKNWAEEGLRAITEVIREYGTYPIKPETFPSWA